MLLFCLITAIVIIFLLIIKIYLLKKSAREIINQLDEKLSEDTNTLISISSGDEDMCELASALNDRLKVLRSEYIRYSQGDADLKKAVTNISHDLRTPLTAICGYLDFLKDEEKSEQAEQYLQIIGERTNALKQLTEELLKYSSAVSGEYSLHLEDVAINSILEESILSYQAILQGNNIIPEIEITDKKIVRKADPSALSRVFANLLNNALKYSDGDLFITMDEKGVIKFSNHAKTLDGIEVGKLFDRFYTVENIGQSSGLGLSIAKILIEQMNGSISADYNNGLLEITIM